MSRCSLCYLLFKKDCVQSASESRPCPRDSSGLHWQRNPGQRNARTRCTLPYPFLCPPIPLPTRRTRSAEHFRPVLAKESRAKECPNPCHPAVSIPLPPIPLPTRRTRSAGHFRPVLAKESLAKECSKTVAPCRIHSFAPHSSANPTNTVRRTFPACYGKVIPGKGMQQNRCTLAYPFLCPSFLCQPDEPGPRNISGLYWQRNPGQRNGLDRCALLGHSLVPSFLCQ